MVETRQIFFTEKKFDSVDVVFEFVMTFWCETKKEHGNENVTTLPKKINSHEKKVFGGGHASGDTISEWNGWCVTPPPKKIMAEMMLDPPGSRHWASQSNVFWKSETVDTAVALCLKDVNSRRVGHISPLLHCCGGRKAPDVPFFFFPQFFFSGCLGCWSCSFFPTTTPKIRVGSYQHTTWSLRALVDGGETRWISQRQIGQFAKRSIPDLDGKSRIQQKTRLHETTFRCFS